MTGAAGAVGRRTVRQLVEPSDADVQPARVVALDRQPLPFQHDLVEFHRTDLLADDLGHHLVDADVVIHLAEDGGGRGDAGLAEHLLNRVLDGADAAEVRSLMVLSSATVYGAHPDNPIPITESQPPRPIDTLEFAVAKARLEEQARAWADECGGSLVIVRPTTTLSEDGVSWVAAAIRSASAVSVDQVDPPRQFLHHDDLASALVVIARSEIDGVVNVAPDGWINPEVFGELASQVPVRLSRNATDRLLEVGRRVGVGRTPAGIEAYVRHPWVIANDRLRSLGWEPSYSNEEAYVAGTPAPPWAVSAQRRQELALGVAGIGVAGAMGVAASLTRRLVR